MINALNSEKGIVEEEISVESRNYWETGCVKARRVTDQPDENENKRALNVLVIGPGRVMSVPAGIDCPGTCSALFDAGTLVQLSRQAIGTADFISWSGDCSGTGACELDMSAPRGVSALFGHV